MSNIICIDEKYSTTRLVRRQKPKIVNNHEDKFESLLFLPKGEGRKGEGGLRTKGYFKKSYKDKPLVSIITVVYNGEKYLEETIRSVTHQSYDNVEYIIIDGGSNDGTLDIIREYDDRIDYWISEKDKGISDAFNKGVQCCTGELIGIINADDYYEKESFESFISKYDFTDCIIYGNTYSITLENEKKVKKDNKRSWCMSVPFSHCSSFSSASYYKKFGLFKPEFKIAMDIDLLMRGLNKANYIYVDSFIATQRAGGISDTSRLEGYKEYMMASQYTCNIFKRYFFYLLKVIIIYKNKVVK